MGCKEQNSGPWQEQQGLSLACEMGQEVGDRHHHLDTDQGLTVSYKNLKVQWQLHHA